MHDGADCGSIDALVEAIEKIASVRSVVSPIEFFLHQLELFERCNYDLNPSKYPEYRRFLMNYNAQDMLDGDGVDQLILAYYPSPAPSPRRSPGLPDPFLSMTPMSGATTPGGGNAHSRRGSSNSISSQEARSEILARVRRGSFGAGASATLGMTAASNSRRMSEGQSLTPGGGGGGLAPLTRRKSSRTKSTGERDAELAKLRALLDEKKRKEAEELAAKMQKNGAGPSAAAKADPNAKVVHMGVERDYTKERRLRCKMCRRDLAAREHILEHEPGQGQRAFAPNRRDMTQHRLDTEKRRQDKAKEREARQAERQRLAAEAAEDLLLEAEDAVASGSEGSGDEEGPAGEEDAQTKAAPEATGTNTGASSSRPPVSRPAPKSASSGSTAQQGRPQQQQQQQQQQSSLASRLPPQLAGLRVAMPHRSMVHDLSNATHGSAIDDDDEAETPAASSPQQSKQLLRGGPGAGGPASPPLLPSSVCTSYFTEPLSWMQNQLENGELSGRILCPNTKCGAKLGTFDWSGCESPMRRQWLLQGTDAFPQPTRLAMCSAMLVCSLDLPRLCAQRLKGGRSEDVTRGRERVKASAP